MNLTKLLLVACAALMIAGCSSVSLPKRFAAVPPQTRVIKSDAPQAYDAALAAAKQLGFRYVRGGPKTGELEAISEIQRGGPLLPARQFTIHVHLRAVSDTETEVAVLLHEVNEIAEGDFRSGATRQPLRDHGLYDAYFAGIEHVLGQKAEGKPL
ncbi:MAG: hypothetical protein PHQ04_11965 [Opitutaceae bacterium]|nr:hypothetical protein [Opitutaceae bacterium]